MLKTLRTLLLSTLAFASLFLTNTAVVMAQSGLTNPAIGAWGNNNAAAKSGSLFATVFVYFWRAIILVGALLVVFYFISGAIDYITAGGEKGKTEAARNKITTAVIGFILLAFSFTAISVIGRVVGFDLLDLNFNFNPSPITAPGEHLRGQLINLAVSPQLV